MNVKTITEEYLKAYGHDGLAYDDCGCGGNDLMCCDGDCSLCVPAKKHVVTQEDLDSESIGCMDVEVGDTIYLADPEPKGARDDLHP